MTPKFNQCEIIVVSHEGDLNIIEKHLWIIDTGESCHITGSRKGMSDIRES